MLRKIFSLQKRNEFDRPNQSILVIWFMHLLYPWAGKEKLRAIGLALYLPIFVRDVYTCLDSRNCFYGIRFLRIFLKIGFIRGKITSPSFSFDCYFHPVGKNQLLFTYEEFEDFGQGKSFHEFAELKLSETGIR